MGISQEFDLTAVFAARRAEFGDARMDSESSVEADSISQDTSDDTQSQNGTGSDGVNPSWQEILNVLPDSLHGTVMPALEKWDRNYQSGIQRVQSQYEPYQPLLDAGYDPETIQYGLSVLAKLEEDPRAIYDALAEAHGFAVDQGQSETEIDDDVYEGGALPDDPRIQRAEEMSEAVAQWVLEQHEMQQNAEEDANLDQEMTNLAEKHGEYDENYVMGLMLTGVNAEDAVMQYHQLVQNIASKPRANDSAPVIMGSGGGLPSGAVKVSELTEDNRQKLVADMLRQAAQT